MTDPIVDAVCAKFQSRSAVGIKKYGTTLADNVATVKEKLTHIQEELMDGANYVEWLLQEKEMPTPMTIEMEADGRRAALNIVAKFIFARDQAIDFLPEKTNENLSEWLSHFVHNVNYRLSFNDWMNLETIRAALQSAQVKAETVDLETLKRVHPIRDRANGVYSSASYEVDGYNRAIDEIKSKYGDLYTIERE